LTMEDTQIKAYRGVAGHFRHPNGVDSVILLAI
jgi:hypothetical protein